MALNSRHSVTRSITTAAVGLVTAGLLASCGGNTTAGTPVKQTAASQSASNSSELRLGCATYCQDAGILNGEAGEGQRCRQWQEDSIRSRRDGAAEHRRPYA